MILPPTPPTPGVRGVQVGYGQNQVLRPKQMVKSGNRPPPGMGYIISIPPPGPPPPPPEGVFLISKGIVSTFCSLREQKIKSAYYTLRYIFFFI
jgi:hypothetical protein